MTLVLVAGCTGSADDDSVTVQPGAPGEPGRVLTDPPTQPHDDAYTDVDVHFLHVMIYHHEQALRMVELVDDRADRAEINLLAARIGRSQEDELALMADWLAVRGEPHEGDHPDVGGMPGMLSEADFAELAEATGATFDQRFLELMIHHHEGALIMVADLREVGGAQEPALAEFTTHLDVDQRIEIDRMRSLLSDLD